MAAPARYRLVGSFQVALPPERAFRLFTPAGERDWVDGWDPRFPDSDTDADTEPGTVFETASDGRAVTWVVLDRQPGRRMSYARVAHGVHAGTVTVTLEPAGDDHAEVTVAYDLTALTEAARDELRRFADDYPNFLRSWRRAIADKIT
ncbi:SRPBCC family protein [Pseudonocardia acaciae]|uniref:SRPBCC family protein n=1 Tax=Pseudonocardia acaciae TaxID=551276 RepID=UPI00049200B1|nr:SRPBCC family protein [Pseudonocardia acaciae]